MVPAITMTPAGAAQRQHLTLLFIDLSGSSRLAEALEAEQFAAVLQTLRDVCRAAIDDHGGRIVRVQGDGVLAMFGHPRPAEDDGLRAARAALEIHHSFDSAHRAELPGGLRPLRLHSGLHSGLVLISEGDVERGRFELIGDAANTAARLAQIAPPGVVLADLNSLGPHAHFFQLDGITELTLPGRSLAVRAARLLGHSGVQRRLDGAARGGLTPFVGRQQLLDSLASQMLTAVQQRSRHKVLLQGQAGIGKSRLLDEIACLPQAAAWLKLPGCCADEARAQVLQPFVEMVRTLGCGAPAGTANLADELFDTISARALGRNLLLLIDDWQWADDASRQLLERLMAAVPVVLAVLATRPLFDMLPAGPDDTGFVLAPFDEADTARTVKRWLPGADPFTIAEIHRQAGGVPLYVEELAHSAASQQPLRLSQKPFSTSGWLAALVASRLARLPTEQQEVVRTAAVLGGSFPLWLLLNVGGWRELDLNLNALADADFLFTDDSRRSLRFKHGLTRAAVYDTVGLQERRAVHRRATRALAAADADPATLELLEGLAYHSRAAGLWDEAVDHAERAAEQAGAAFAMDIARRHCLAALEALECSGVEVTEVGGAARLARWCRVVHKLGMTCIFDPLALPDALPLFERCLARAQSTRDDGLVARSLYWLAYICYGQGQPRRAAQFCRQALTLARAMGDERLMAQLEATLGQVLAAAGDYEEALPLMDGALKAKQQSARRGAGVAVGSAFTLACKGSILADRGDFDGAQTLLEQAAALVGDTAHPVANSVRNWAMIVLLWQGRWHDAVEVTGHSVRMAHSTNALLPLAISRASEGYALWTGLGAADGLDQIVQAVQWMEQRQGRFFTSIFYGWLVEGFVAQGKQAQARHFAAALFARARAGETLGLAAGCRALALAAAQGGDSRRSERHLQRAQRCAVQRGSRREAALNELCRAQWLHGQGLFTLAARHAEGSCKEFEAMNMRWHAAKADVLR